MIMAAMKTIAYLVVALPFAFPATLRAQVTQAVDGDVVKLASTSLVNEHLRKNVDQNQLSREWARRFMLSLDPVRMHFLASDEAEFIGQSTSLLADARKSDVRFPTLVTKRFRKRLEANALLINKLLATAHDFTIDESVQIEHQTYAANKQESEERWRLRIKYELLMEKINRRDSQGARKFLHARYRRIGERFESLPPSKLRSLYLDALAKSFDPHSWYIDEEYLTLYRTSQIPAPAIDQRLEYRQGDLWLRSSGERRLNGSQPFTARRIVAVRKIGQPAIHLVGLPYGDAHRTIISPIGELGLTSRIVVEVDDPRRGYRDTVVIDRWPRS